VIDINQTVLVKMTSFSSQKQLLSRSTSDALLSSRISLPRVGSVLGDVNYQCDNCGYRNFSCVDISQTRSDGGIKARGVLSHRRPQSMFADQNNYVRFSFREEDLVSPNTNTPSHGPSKHHNKPHRKERSENHYETVGDGWTMNTMDVRIKITQEIIKESDQFSEDSHPGQFSEDSAGEERVIKSDIRRKAKNFKRKCLARISSLTVR